MLHREVIEIYTENHMNPINALYGKSFLMLKQVVHIVVTVL
jgi:hypothetical protein